MKADALARRVGVPGFAAMAVLAWAAWTRWVVEPGIDDGIAALRDQVREARVHAAAPVASMPAGEALLRDFRARLPEDAESNETLAAILKRARTDGLTVDTARFETEAAHLPGVVRHRADLPLKGRYGALRAWLARALHDNAGLTLDALEFKRRDVAANDVEANVTLSLWARTADVRVASRAEGEHGRR